MLKHRRLRHGVLLRGVLLRSYLLFILLTSFRFENHSKVFTALTALTGGSYAALSLVSSNVFGLNLTSSGLTKNELKQLAEIKIRHSVLLENAPQVWLSTI